MQPKLPVLSGVPPDEMEQRVSVLKRLRELLSEQRGRFQNYLDVLEKQKTVINQGNIDDLAAHVELEEKIVTDILALQKSIGPLRVLYQHTGGAGKTPPDLGELGSTLDSLKMEASRRIRENRELLHTKMEIVRTELKNVRGNPFKTGRRSVYADTAQPSLLDIKG